MSDPRSVSDGRPVEALTASALAVSLSVVLHQLWLFRMPQGGEITLGSTVPIWIVARRYGLGRGATAGLAAGMLLFVLGPVAVHPLEPFLDYGIAWAALGLAAVTNTALSGAFLSLGVRYLTETLSGVLFFASYAPPGISVWSYSLLYNSYLAVDGLLAVCLLELIGERAPELLGGSAGGGEPDAKGSRAWIRRVCILVVLVMLCQSMLWHLMRQKAQPRRDSTAATQGIPGKAKPGSGADQHP